MTEATSLASEQITQEDREAAASIVYQWNKQRFLDGSADASATVQAFARHRIAALSASPAPSGQGVSGVADFEASSAERLREQVGHAFAAPAPSCAPGEVAALVQRLFDKRWASSNGEWGVPDWVETDEPRRVGEQILAALSPQGLDAKEGGE